MALNKEEKKILDKCREKINAILDKYQQRGLIDKVGSRTRWIENSVGLADHYIHLKFKWNIRKISNSYICFSLNYINGESGIIWTQGVIDALFDKEHPEHKYVIEKVKDLDVWKELSQNIIKEINEKTVFLRFMYKKILEKKREGEKNGSACL